MKLFKIILPILLFSACSNAQNPVSKNYKPPTEKILAGADRIEVYLPLLKNKSVGIFANQTSMVGNSHLVDTLQTTWN